MAYFRPIQQWIALAVVALGILCGGILSQLQSTENDPEKRKSYAMSNWALVGVSLCAIGFAIDKFLVAFKEFDFEMSNMDATRMSYLDQLVHISNRHPDITVRL